MKSNITQLAARQLHDYRARTPGTVFAEEHSLSEDEAYAVQTEVCRLREQSGERVVGYKIGCTSPVIQKQLEIDHPIFGRLFSIECHESGIELPANQFANLAIEGELAVCLANHVPRNCRDRDRILECVASVFPVIELHNHVRRGPRPTASELIANNALHAGIVMAEQDLPRPPSEELSLRIMFDDDTVAEIASFQWKETVAEALVNLNSLLEVYGRSLQAEQLVLTGSLAELIPTPAGTRVEVITIDHGSVHATFTP